MKITIIFPARNFEIGKPTMPVMPLAPTLLAALTPQEHEISLIDMFYGDAIDYDTGCDLVAITVRTPLAVVAYEIADKFTARGKTVVLGGPHIFANPNEAKEHAAAVAIGEGGAALAGDPGESSSGPVMGFFVIGWDEDSPDTCRRTLDFCDEMNIIPFILTLVPMPGSKIYDEYLAQGRILTGLSWNHYGGESIVFKHPTRSAEDMFEGNSQVLQKGYSLGRVLSRTFHTIKKRPSLDVAMNSFFTQTSLKKSFREQFKGLPK